jgi:hypothetical protein
VIEHKKLVDVALYPKDTRPYGFNFRKPIPESTGPLGSIKAISATLGPDVDIFSTDTDHANGSP